MSFSICNHRRRDARGRKGIAGMKIIALIFAFVLTGCAGDRLQAATKCDAVSAVLGNPAATRGQVAAAMEMGRNNGCFGTGPPRRAGDS
jgi:hypothetical protein